MPSPKLKCRTCPALVYADNITGQCRLCLNLKRKAATPVAQLAADREREAAAFRISTLQKKYDESLNIIKRQERDLRVVNELAEAGVQPFRIEPQLPSGKSEGAVCLVASDWHVEERVDPSKINGLNQFDTDIAKTRAEKFFASGLRLTKLLQQDIKIKALVLALLGDFLSNDIHEDFPEINQLQPMHALLFAQNLIVSGIRHLLEESDLDLVIVCHSGNHARTTKKTRFGAENGHSLEYLMYVNLATYFAASEFAFRVTFRIADGYHSMLDVYGTKVRFHHGHAINYQGGIGGIFIPAFKAISQWDKANRADLDVFGHFHQSKDGGKFLCNGSLIGYNAFALSIKADFEPPKQTLFLIDKRRGRTCTWPVLFGEAK